MCSFGALDEAEPNVDEEVRQWRAARAAILLMGDSGLRFAEATLARRRSPEDIDMVDRRSVGCRLFGPPASASMDDLSLAQKALPDPIFGTVRATRAFWTLIIIGKRCKQRTVPMSGATIAALRSHWADRRCDIDAPRADRPFIAPHWIPATRGARAA